MFYSVKGEYSEIPHTEVYIITANKIVDFYKNVLVKNVLKNKEVKSKKGHFKKL